MEKVLDDEVNGLWGYLNSHLQDSDGESKPMNRTLWPQSSVYFSPEIIHLYIHTYAKIHTYTYTQTYAHTHAHKLKWPTNTNRHILKLT